MQTSWQAILKSQIAKFVCIFYDSEKSGFSFWTILTSVHCYPILKVGNTSHIMKGLSLALPPKEHHAG